MRCPGCEYPLWNLTARLCPECGRPFAPSDFDFITNSVRFCCPHCNQDYYGTGPRGHLEPIEFDCAKCRNHIHMDQMVLLPTEGVKEEQTEVDFVPWLNRPKVGFLRGLFATITRAMFEPSRLARATPQGSGVGPAYVFSLIANLGFVIFGAGGALFLFPFMFMAAARPGGTGVPKAAGFFLFGGLLFVLLITMAFLALLFPFWGLVAHLILRLTGRTRLGPGASVRTLCYASGVNACAGIPCLGVYLAPFGAIWTGISAAIMLRIVHGVGWIRALMAGLGLPFAAAALAVAWVYFIVVPGITNSVTAARQSMQQITGTRLNSAFAAYRARHNNQFPPHGISFMDEGDLFSSDFTSLVFGQAPSQPDPTLTSFQMLSPQQRAATVRGLIASLPPSTIAHRLGDVVFTYHGIDPAGDPNLWLAIEIPEKAAPGPSASIQVFPGGATTSDKITVILNRNPPDRFDAGDLATKLAKQNELRAKYGLAPLPDPTTISATTPATSASSAPPP